MAGFFIKLILLICYIYSMSEKKDWDQIAKIEKAITEKYGKEAIQNPKNNWDDEKEKIYLEQLKKIAKRDREKQKKVEKIEIEGFFASKKLFNRESNRTCPICNTYSFKVKDDAYMIKFKCCYKCYILHIEDREENWEKKREELLRSKTNVSSSS